MNNEVELTNDGLDYTNVHDFTSWISSNKAGLASNDVINNNTPDNINIREALLFAESEFDSYASEHYNTPVVGTLKTMYYIKKICYSIAKYQLFGRRGITKESYYEYSSVQKDLAKLSSGDIKIPGGVLRNNAEKIKMGSEFEAPFSDAEKEGFSI